MSDTADCGATLVIEDLNDIPRIVACFANSCSSDRWEGDPAELASVCRGKVLVDYFGDSAQTEKAESTAGAGRITVDKNDMLAMSLVKNALEEFGFTGALEAFKKESNAYGAIPDCTPSSVAQELRVPQLESHEQNQGTPILTSVVQYLANHKSTARVENDRASDDGKAVSHSVSVTDSGNNNEGSTPSSSYSKSSTSPKIA